MSTKKAEVTPTSNTSAQLFCPECKAGPYATNKGMSTHRRTAHGVAGMSKSAILERKQRENTKPLTQLPTPAPLSPASTAASPSRQEKNTHVENQPGKNPSGPGKNQSGKKRGPYKRTKAKAGSTEIVHQARTQPREAPPQIAFNREASGIPEPTLAVAYGRFIEFQNGLARELDLPPRQFAREFTALIRRSS